MFGFKCGIGNELAKSWRQQQGYRTELDFETFCDENGISHIRLEDDGNARARVLVDAQGKCPDYLCSKNGSHVFVEVKTHTLFTNEARRRYMTQVILAKKAAGLSGTTIFDSFDPRPELRGVFDGYLRDSSKKFKNIKEEYTYPRILFLSGIHVNEIDVRAIFTGSYPSLRIFGNGESSYVGYVKKERGLLDETGKSVSAVIYWDDYQNRYGGVGNSLTHIKFSESEFKNFFESDFDGVK